MKFLENLFWHMVILKTKTTTLSIYMIDIYLNPMFLTFAHPHDTFNVNIALLLASFMYSFFIAMSNIFALF